MMETDQVLDAIKKLDARRLHEEPHEENNMETIDLIHQKLETMQLSPFELREVKHLIDLAHRIGLARTKPADPLKGYSNLTEAIKAGEPIDWERLDGLKVQCVNPELVGELHGVLERDLRCDTGHSSGWLNHASGWTNGSMDGVYISALNHAWHGRNGWTLWLEGDIPMRRKTADQLPVTTFFKGCRVGTNGAGSFMCVGESKHGKFILSAIDFLPSPVSAEKWEVLEEYGPFQKPEENKK